MGDSDDDESSSSHFQLTSILFGNIDESGQLEDDILDSVSKRHLASLARLGLSSIISELIGDAELGAKSANHNFDSEPNSSDQTQSIGDQYSEDYDIKSPSAIDYSDINELADDFNNVDVFKIKNEGDGTDYDADDEEPHMKLDLQLMPPPPLPEVGLDKDNVGDSEDVQTKKLDTPLAAMLPSKYANVDVRELFPDFRHDKVLRFSRLFGPGKPSSMPQIWRSVRKRRKKKKHHHNNQQPQSDSGSDQETYRHKKVGWALQYGSPPPPEKCRSDDEEKLLRPQESRSLNKSMDNGDNSDMGPKVADWRFGPAQVWYDMLDVPETGEGFNYGFKIKEKMEEDEDKPNEGFPDDAFLMVSQLRWEDDVVWNGDDIKHKVLQKLNSKTNAAGWLPSSSNRTAQAFSQPGKGVPQLPGNVRLATSAINLNTSANKQNKPHMYALCIVY